MYAQNHEKCIGNASISVRTVSPPLSSIDKFASNV